MAAWESAPLVDDAPAAEKSAKPAWESAPLVEARKPFSQPMPDAHGPLSNLAGSVGKEVGDAASSAWGQLKSDWGRAMQDVPKPSGGFWDSQAAQFDKLMGVGKLPLDVAGVALSPIAGATRALVGNPISSITGGRIKPEDVDMALSAVSPGKVPGVGARLPAVAPKLSSAQEARSAGYVLHPAMVPETAGWGSEFLAGWGGKHKTWQAASVRNQEVTDALAAKGLGLPEDTVLSQGKLREIRTEAGLKKKAIEGALPEFNADPQYFDDLKRIFTKDERLQKDYPTIMKENPEMEAIVADLRKPSHKSDAALRLVTKLRADAKANLRAGAMDPTKASLGMAQRQAAEALDALMERRLDAAASIGIVPPNLVAEYKQARQLIAKTHDVEDAYNPATGNVSAARLFALLKRGQPLTGELRTIAETFGRYGKVMQSPVTFGGAESTSVLDVWAAGAAAMSGHPAGAAAALSRNPIRSTLLSRRMQDRMVPPATPAAPAMTYGPPSITGAVAGPLTEAVKPRQP